jgi:hypothetical protein
MPDEPRKMIRVPTPLIEAVKEFVHGSNPQRFEGLWR